jgi:cell division protein FtsZ
LNFLIICYNKKMTKKNKKVDKKKKEESSLREIKVRVIGVGGGGGSIVSGISSNIKKVLFSAVNTDVHALDEITKKKKIKGVVFGKSLTGGLGTGMDQKLGRDAAVHDIEEVKKLFKDQDIVIFVASLGGGTGTGAMPIFSQTAKEMGCLVYGVFTLPFSFEGEKKTKIAKDAIRESSPHLHAITVMPNEKIFAVVDKNTPLKEALMIMNKTLADSLEGLVETIYETGLINIDFADVRTVLENRKGERKLTYLNSIEGTLEEGAEEIVKRAISNPLYPYPINKTTGILFNIIGGKDIGLTDISSISESIAKHTEDDAKIIIGIMQKAKYKNKVKVSLLATGCETDFLKKELSGCEDKGIKKIKKKKDVVEKKEEKKAEKITVVPTIKKDFHFFSEKKKAPENEEEKEIFEEEEKWEKPSFLRRIS